MIKKILFVQPFVLEKEHLTDEILIWEVYLENYLKKKLPYLQFDLLYLPVEQDMGSLKIASFKENELFEKQMITMVSELDFELDGSTLIGISVTTSHHYLSSKLIAEFFHKFYPNSYIVFGGAHASSCPNDFIDNNSTGDFIIVGEGEVSLYDLIKNPLKKQKKPVIINKKPINDLDDLPLLDFSILDKYIKNFKHLSISLSRGCPFKCVFCIEHNLLANGHVKKWRCYSPKRAILEVKRMIEYGSENGIALYGFYDPIFGMSKKWLTSFLDLYVFEEQTQVWIETRLDLLNDKLLQKLNHKNFYLMYGLESYSKKMLSVMNKTNNPTIYLNKFEELFLIHKKLGSFFILNILCNHPGETDKSQLETFSRLEEMIVKDNIDPMAFNIRFYHHFTGTRIYTKFENFQKKYGSYAFFPEWYKREELLKYGPYAVRPSAKYTLRESFNKYTKYYINLLNNSLDNMKKYKQNGNLLKIFNLKNQVESLKNKKGSFFKFLDENEIEIG
ncbi:MAG: B12-binding domain-containing radical SAM protein [Promethearchaeota archaeon]